MLVRFQQEHNTNAVNAKADWQLALESRAIMKCVKCRARQAGNITAPATALPINFRTEVILPKCRNCKTTTENKFGLTTLCSIPCAIEYANKAKAKKVEQEKKNERKTIKAARERTKTLKTLCAEARKVVQEYARKRDIAQGYTTCICCGVGGIEHGGHFYAVGSKYQNSRLSLNPRQIHGCCVKCNKYVGGGNRPGYEAGLEARYGAGILSDLAELKRKADSGEDLPLTKEEVQQIKVEYRAKIRELKSKVD